MDNCDNFNTGLMISIIINQGIISSSARLGIFSRFSISDCARWLHAVPTKVFLSGFEFLS